MSWGVTLGGNFFNALDVILLLVLMIGGIGGALVGFIESFSRSAGYVLGTIGGLMFTVPVAGLFMGTFALAVFPASLLAFVVLFMATFILVRIAASILQRVVDLSVGLEAIDRLLGFFWGFLTTFLIVALICYAMRSQKLVNVTPMFNTSQFITRVIDPYLPAALRAVKESML